MNKLNIFFIGLIIGLVVAFVISGYYYETGKSQIKIKNNIEKGVKI